jgi:redox-sensitive bicupin YhaK (pirin superfamily)
MAPDAEFDVDASAVERAVYVLEGKLQLDGVDIPEQHLIVLDRGVQHRLRATSNIKAMLFGGEPLDAPRHMWWNFVSSSKERIEQAKQDWLEDRYGKIEGETEFIPLPER